MTEPSGNLWVALVHHPVLDRNGATITTSVTNLDVHDLARSGATYGIKGLAIVTPIDAQRAIVERIIGYWQEPRHAARIPGRPQSLALVHCAASVDEVIGLASSPVIIGTSAKPGERRTTFARLRQSLQDDPRTSRLILLGSGWGLAPELLGRCDQILEPITGPTDYNHLSVRSAAAIMLDRLLGVRNR
jgi:hypothetical protein